MTSHRRNPPSDPPPAPPSVTRPEVGVMNIGERGKILARMASALIDQAEEDEQYNFESEDQEVIPGYTRPGPVAEPGPLPPENEPTLSVDLDPARGDVSYMFDKLKEVVTQLEQQGVLLPSDPVLVDNRAIIRYTCVPRVLSVSTADDKSSVQSDLVPPAPPAQPTPVVADASLASEVESVFVPISLQNLMGRPISVSLRDQEVTRDDVLKAFREGRKDNTVPGPTRPLEEKVYYLLDLSEKGRRFKRILRKPR
uniref:Phosphoprotein n=1 Tax=Tongren Rhabd tick virus 3 TaxID=2972337 RepID=A0A9E8AAA3_9RHAB|nr:MAG: putative phosphoprotein [Tongren Rhabd tick virus 3]